MSLWRGLNASVLTTTVLTAGSGGITVRKSGNVQWGLERAKRQKLVIVQPAPNQLQIDLDGVRQMRQYGMLYSILRKAGITKGWRERVAPSKKANHVHVTITLPKAIGDLERVTLQAVLGSDVRREAFNYIRVTKRNKYPIVFFERKQA